MPEVNWELLSTVYSPPPAEKPWRLEDVVPDARIRYFSFGRRALAEGLRLARVGRPDRVLLPEYICRDVLSSAAAAGARTVFYPVGPDLRPAAPPEKWPEAKAVIAVNYFGFPQDLSPFRAYCRLQGAVLIEDNAHGLFSRNKAGRALGARADLGILSLRKSLPIRTGAALIIPPGKTDWELAPQETFVPDVSFHWRMKGAVRALARSLGPRGALRALSTFRAARGFKTGHRRPPTDPMSESELPEPASPGGVLAAPLTVADPARETLRRRSLYELVGEHLEKAGFKPVFPSLPEGTVPYAFPFKCSPKHRGEAQRLLRDLGLEALPWPDLPDSVAPDAPAHYTDVLLAHFLW